MSKEGTGEFGTGAVPKETSLPVASQVADVLLRGADVLLGGVVVGIWLDIGEGLGKGTEWAARRLNGNYDRYMRGLEEYYSSPNDHVSGV